jgi:hypothetical protein
MRKTRRRTWHVYFNRRGWWSWLPALHVIVQDASSRHNAIRLALRYWISGKFIKRQPKLRHGAFDGVTAVPV